MYRLIAIDLDGTLLTPAPHKMITPRTYKALHDAAAAGIKIVITTGQTLAVLQHVCAGLPLAGPQIIENGAIVADFHTGEILHEQLFPEAYILPALDAMRALLLYRVYHTHEGVYADRGAPRVRTWYRPPVPPAIEVEDVARLYPRTCIKLAGVGEAATLVMKRKALERIFAGQLYVTQSAYDLLEFLHPQVSKGQALREIAADLGITPPEIVAIGDNYNDISMLRFAGLGVAMANAPDEVKEVADHVTLSNSQEGVATVIEEMVLNEAG